MPLILLNKPCRVLSRFTDDSGKVTLAQYVRIPEVYPAGRLDYDSEGLLLLTSDGRLQARIADPRHKLPKRYLAQVEGEVDDTATERLGDGVAIRGGYARALDARRTDEPEWLWPRDPPIRFRKNVPDSWISITIDEGRNRQVRRMCAAVGLPVLRLIRTQVGPWTLAGLAPGEHRTMALAAAWRELRGFRTTR